MWTLSKRWWIISLMLLLPGVIITVIGIAAPPENTAEENRTMLLFGILSVAFILLLHFAVFVYLARQKKRAVYFQENGLRGTATILSAATTGTTINDMPQIELKLEIDMPGKAPYTITDRRCWNPLSLAGLQRGARLQILVDPEHPAKIMFTD